MRSASLFFIAATCVTLAAAAQVSSPDPVHEERAMNVERVKIQSDPGDFALTFDKPGHWIPADLPAEPGDADFSQPFKFVPVCLFIDPTKQETRPPMFMVAARPAYADGAVSDWLEAICAEQRLKHGPIGRAQFGDSPAVYCRAQMTTDDQAQMVIVLVEDGGRLINLAFLTPASEWEQHQEALNTFLNSFRIAAPKRPVAPITPEESTQQPSSEMALADDTSTLDPSNPINANLMNNGIGLVPNVVKKDDQTKTATLACGALQSFIELPYGWHAIDDGRRVLIFDPKNLTQINCAVVERDGATDRQLLEKTLEGLQQELPEVAHRIDEIDGIDVLMVRDALIDGQRTQQAYMLAAAADPKYAIKIRISSTGDMNHVVRSINVGGKIRSSLRR